MATRVTVTVPEPLAGEEAEARLTAAIDAAFAVCHEVDRTCTRFDAESPLMRANRDPRRWHVVPATLLAALREAKSAHDATAGRFDPRVLRSLVELGYDRTLAFSSQQVRTDARWPARRSAPPAPWRPRFRAAERAVRLGADPVDLGGIGKGLAVRWASAALAGAAPSHLVEAGGDFYCAGSGPDGEPWRLGVEDPGSAGAHVAILAVRDRGVATSSIRLRRWSASGRPAHHLIDPSTGLPGGEGLTSVTVVGRDPARAEVWSKALFVAGRAHLAAIAARRSIPALWVRDDGSVAMSDAMRPYLAWEKS